MDINDNKNLNSDVSYWQEKCQSLEEKVAELEKLNAYYVEMFRLSKQKRFGKSSEQMDGQPGLFDEVELEADINVPEPQIEEVETPETPEAHKRGKRVGKRECDLSKLPTERVEHELEESEQICPECGEKLHVMGHDCRRELKIIPARAVLLKHYTSVYACRNCEKTSDHSTIVRAATPEPVIKGSIASPSAIATIAIQKYRDSVPLYRQSAALLQVGVDLSRQTMANWLIRGTGDWLKPLYNLMKSKIVTEPVLHADETVVQVLREPGRKANTNSYMWLYRSGYGAEHPTVLYEYQTTRSSTHPKRFLSGFNGYLHVDGYAGYHSLGPGVTVVGCWAHVRRRFHDALMGTPEEVRRESQAQVGLSLCSEMFLTERTYAEESPEVRLAKKQSLLLPKIDNFFSWARNCKALPKSLLGKAIRYALEQEKHLRNVVLDGRLEFSNNRAERSIKPFVIGRKNWLFSNTPKGAETSSIIYSIIETAKENNLKPFEYLEHIFTMMPNMKMSEVETLLPWSETLPDQCRLKV
jgi:transposase